MVLHPCSIHCVFQYKYKYFRTNHTLHMATVCAKIGYSFYNQHLIAHPALLIDISMQPSNQS